MREARLKRALRAELAEMTPERAQELADDPFQALTFILRTHLKAGDLSAAAATARELLPYCKSKKAAVDPEREALPEDMQPDPEPQPDEPIPEGGVVEGRTRLSANADGG